jgi:eukaryotic-like serine/threonine-protein kinase
MEPYVRGGTIAGKYRLDRQIGEGGRGSIWVATDIAVAASVTLKVLHGPLRTPAATHRLRNEAVAAAGLSHPAIVRILDHGVSEHGDPYIVTEPLRGDRLTDVLEQNGPLRPDRAVQMLLPILHALEHAHGRDVIHRDVCPANVVLTLAAGRRAQPKLVDFGAAQLPGETGRPGKHGPVGTPEWMAPELALGQGPVDGRADVWSVAAVLYTCIRGVPPFQGETLAEVLPLLIHERPRRLSVDARLWKIIERGLRRDPESRWQTMEGLRIALASWLLDRGVREDATGATLERDDPAPSRSSGARRTRRGRRRAIGVAAMIAAMPLVLVPSFRLVEKRLHGRDRDPAAAAAPMAAAPGAAAPGVPPAAVPAAAPDERQVPPTEALATTGVEEPADEGAAKQSRRSAQARRYGHRYAFPLAPDAEDARDAAEPPPNAAAAAADAKPAGNEADVYESDESPADPYADVERKDPQTVIERRDPYAGLDLDKRR